MGLVDYGTLTIALTVILISSLQLLSLTLQVKLMSARTDSLKVAIIGLTSSVDAAAAAIAALKASQADPTDVAAVEQAVSDIQAATAKLAAAVA